MAHLHRALDAQQYQQALVILGYTSAFDKPDENGLTPLVKCCKVAHKPQVWAIIRELVLQRARLHLKDEEGRSILHLAACNKATKVARLLISTGNIDVQCLDVDGNTPLHGAASVDAVEIARSILIYLLRYDMDVDPRNKPGFTPLMLACKHGHLQTARLLIQLGRASLTMKDNVHHKSAEEWLTESLDIPTGVDPFTCDPELLRNKRCTPVSRIQSAKKEKRVSTVLDLGRHRRVQSAPSTRTKRVEPQPPRPATHSGRAFSAPQVAWDIPSIKQQLRPIFDVYSVQESSSYRRSAMPPKLPTPPPTPSPPKSPKSQARQRLQKFFRQKRAENIVKALTGQKRQKRSSFQDVVMAALRRKSPKPELEQRKSPVHDGKESQDSSSNKKRFVSGVRRVVQMQSVPLDTIDHDSNEET